MKHSFFTFHQPTLQLAFFVLQSFSFANILVYSFLSTVLLQPSLPPHHNFSILKPCTHRYPHISENLMIVFPLQDFRHTIIGKQPIQLWEQLASQKVHTNHSYTNHKRSTISNPLHFFDTQPTGLTKITKLCLTDWICKGASCVED